MNISTMIHTEFQILVEEEAVTKIVIIEAEGVNAGTLLEKSCKSKFKW